MSRSCSEGVSPKVHRIAGWLGPAERATCKRELSEDFSQEKILASLLVEYPSGAIQSGFFVQNV
ncbi:MAG: hypothetical protein A3C50_02535 [Candidatus Staskawiczbacteria bacterium RIFCSPHIGHO2_02_FULL_43_16]|uniref:Uncharacterized protein n=1 Tax=Candidatus Staskawiczbacteria bacterium RIFCSPHIGHO2_01_FULL_41_41 TaxID=1802203 RepID=A0A1G2HW33_9BACT|nr:MAG: hypothetical protein A2822_01550 [Candidatus Staskawiczbacteria bacterium RIFCSPHIGHO2_01_FULL_41_41]OGZ68163.1 MAG: hypothetical protein A3C50_02535 [Candidatus Staskawiczbacteria bacterium RIFCSPHIGHO2_02_FULL_43_16]OGZ74953.1 MAG: hypothetical protein A3A12_03930 [Candidatus Staskawiczbacteria bacterium RIFCSPLOWO2_01_FULL_43_17b]